MLVLEVHQRLFGLCQLRRGLGNLRRQRQLGQRGRLRPDLAKVLARLGDVLTAEATELNKAGRTGVYDIQVRNQRGERVAVFRGRSYTLKGKTVVDPASVLASS